MTIAPNRGTRAWSNLCTLWQATINQHSGWTCRRCGLHWWRLCHESVESWHARMVAYGWHGRCPGC